MSAPNDGSGMEAVREVLNDYDLNKFLDKYGDGPPYLQEPSDEVIWRLVGYLRAAKTAAGLTPSPKTATERSAQ